jgi:sialate O-acetylesterase
MGQTMKLFLMLLASLIISAQAQKKPVEIPSVFSDNMVLQQNSNVKFWGKAEAGTKVNIKSSWGKTANAVTKADGIWQAELKTPKAGGPFIVTLTIGDSVITYNNVLAGEVWVCSGQSNMEMPMQGWPPNDTIMNSAAEIRNANYDQIRLITVPKAYSVKKEFNFTGRWEVCSPASVAGFSAAAYFFGKKLHSELKVPVGLIFTSWGGTPVEAWTGTESLAELDEYKDAAKKLENSEAEFEAYTRWLHSHPKVDISSKLTDDRYMNLDFGDKAVSEVDFNDADWKETAVPGTWEYSEIGQFDGVIWYRKKVEIPADWINKDLVLELGPIDDMDITYFNGKQVGSYEKLGHYADKRVYNIPASLNNSNAAAIAVRVMDTQGGGGLYGSKEELKLTNAATGESLPLAGIWKYLVTAEYSGGFFYIFGIENNDYGERPPVGISLGPSTPAALYNAMISPVVPYTIKGAIWYQGESNVGNPPLYARQMPLMIKNWRKAFGVGDFPFYYVQIAPFNYGENSYSQALREAQLKTLSVPHTGMAVTMDISNVNNIHPANKTDVGERLALWALAKDYGKKVKYSGPVYKSSKVEGEKIILTFDYADGLVIKPVNGSANFEIAGEDKVFKPAAVKVEGNKLVVTGEGIKKPAAVRYAWNNTAEGTLFNNAGLPASSFRTDNWDYKK